jgi:hypothetical protein
VVRVLRVVDDEYASVIIKLVWMGAVKAVWKKKRLLLLVPSSTLGR